VKSERIPTSPFIRVIISGLRLYNISFFRTQGVEEVWRKDSSVVPCGGVSVTQIEQSSTGTCHPEHARTSPGIRHCRHKYFSSNMTVVYPISSSCCCGRHLPYEFSCCLGPCIPQLDDASNARACHLAFLTVTVHRRECRTVV